MKNRVMFDTCLDHVFQGVFALSCKWSYEYKPKQKMKLQVKILPQHSFAIICILELYAVFIE